MDRLNQLRGDAGASRDSTLDTSSLLGEAYTTANDSSKYFSMSEVDSSTTDSPAKEAAVDGTADTSISHPERIISNLSPIPKSIELESFKIGEQIEAANILSGGVNIFDDNENSYDGDELVIDDAVAEGDDKPAEIKLGENSEITFEKTDTSIEDAEAASPSKDTEVVLQIDGKNVDAIDIGNGLYLYRKDGEEELAAVQILDDNQPQPDIKFLKVRENAEGNLEVYEEIEIEVPKEVPTKEGKTVKNTSHIPVKDVNKVSESISNKVAENKIQAVHKDTFVSEMELESNKDNAHVESRTEVNLNGKMMKFNESRKSPLISTFTPMTYHSTPNKEGIPLTKTMVDLQLHPSRHSENVKKTIEVHTDNCKQRLSETPTKSTKDSNEHTKNSEVVSSPSDKNLTIYANVDGTNQISQENNKGIHKALIEYKTDEIISAKDNEDKKSNNSKLGSQETKVLVKNNFESNVQDNKNQINNVIKPNLKTEISTVALGAQCELNMKSMNKEDSVKALMTKTPINETAKVINDTFVDKSSNEVKNDLQSGSGKEILSKCSDSEDIKVVDGMTSVANKTKIENENINSDENIIRPKEENPDMFLRENQFISNLTASNSILSHTDKSENVLKTAQCVSDDSTQKTKHVEIPKINLEMKDINSAKQPENNNLELLKMLPKSCPKRGIKEVNKPFETFDDLTKCVNSATKTNTKGSELLIQTMQVSSGVENINQSELAIPQGGMEKQKKCNEEESSTALTNIKPAEIRTDSLLFKPEPSVNILHKLSKEQLNTVPVVKHQEECKNYLSETVEMKNNTELKSFKHGNKPLGTDIDLSKNLKAENITEVKKNDFENKKKLEKLTKGKKIDAKLNQIETNSCEVAKDVSKCGPSTECKSLNKDSVVTEKNSSHNSFLITKPSTTEKTETQKKNEFTQIPILHKNTKVSLLTSDSKLPHIIQNVQNEIEESKNETKKEPLKVSKVSIPKPINNNKAAVPFGKWTEANRQEFLNKIKESKVPINTSNTKQLKQPNDLNRRDVLQKIDSQRQSNIASTKAQDLNILNKMKLKHETTAFTSKSNVTQKEKLKDDKVSSSKTEDSISVTAVEKSVVLGKKANREHLPVVPVDMSSTALNTKKDPVQRKEINNQDLIDKTIEGIINRAVISKLGPEDVKQDIEPAEKLQNATAFGSVSLDEIESKMNELHGIPFVERPPHELPKVFEHENKSIITPDSLMPSKSSKQVSAIPFTNKPQQNNDHKVSLSVIPRINEESDEEIIEHEPVTGDIELNKNNVLIHGPLKDKMHPQESVTTKVNCDSKKEPIITENEFEKFARRNSITYENCLTVNFDGKEHHNVVQTIVEKEPVPKKLSRNEIMLAESKAKSHKQLAARHTNLSSKTTPTTKTTQDEDTYNKNYQSKVQIAYQSAMTAKRQQECPITIIEDKPVKVVFMDSNHEYIPHQLNVQGKELSPPKKSITEWDHFAHSNSESLDSDILDTVNDSKSQDDIKFKSKHQRKQVLTPVEAPELELIEPGDLGIEVSPKKKRKIEESRSEKNSKSLVPKKSYLLNRNITTDDATSNFQETTKTPLKESINQHDAFVKHSDPISAIDNLVKAAELLETQSESNHGLPPSDHNSHSPQNSPVKRGRGRPRKYPLPDTGSDNKSPSPVKTPTPQKKPRLIDAKIPKHDTESEDDEFNSDGELIKENWTMGKINENIVCPICNKLFRSENVVFKHVKHCTGPSPSRSDSDKRSPRRMRQSQELDWNSEESKSDSMDVDEDFEMSEPSKKRKSKERRSSIDDKRDDKTDVIVIEDTPTKDRDSPINKRERLKHEPNKIAVKAKVQHGISSLVCEFCGKTFRQLSYLVNHRLQHKSTESKISEKDHVHKSLFSCEICKKEFRKLHHLVQHRIIHNPNPMRSSRKSSSEQNDSKTIKDVVKTIEDQSAGFRCEPCDKSFRKLHHLVEHRETHDEINKKCNPVTTVVDTVKPTPLHHCDICKKTFKKLQHLIEHKEHHLDTSSEKSDDKSVKSSLSTKDIIHECPLCYMVFPNEHSLNKHHIICQRKKKQSAAKQAKQTNENDCADVDVETKTIETSEENLEVIEEKPDPDTSCVLIEDETPVVSGQHELNLEPAKLLEQKIEPEIAVNEIEMAEVNLPLKSETDRKTQINEKHIKPTYKKDNDNEANADKVLVKSKKYAAPTATPVDIIKIPDVATPKKKLLAKDKTGATATKRQKTTKVPLSVVSEVKTPDSSDDDEVRYMLNPDFHMEESNEGKMFMKVRAKKRNSLQIERPNSKDLMTRRISLQHPPKIPRLKVKPVPRKPINTSTVVKSSKTTLIPLEALAATDSDDSDVKYSFPEPVMREVAKKAQKKDRTKVVEKRKSLSNIAKRKSLGKIINAKQKGNSTPAKQVKKRTVDAEHRCDCGQLFSSAALLMRHTSLAHTPPRIRRRRSPPPDNDAKPTLKRTEKPQDTRKTIDPAPKKTGVTTRKSSINSEAKVTVEARKTPKTASLAKTRRSIAHKGVPVPEKMRKLAEKSKK